MRTRMRKLRKSGGLSLLEVLIAMLIVGIVATAALPLLGSYTEKTREAREEANMVVKAQAIDRYNFDHSAPLGTVYDPSDSSVVAYGLETMQGPSAQLLIPTDVNGNVMGDPVTASPGPYSHGPYLAELPPEPASLLLATASGRRIRALNRSALKLVISVSGMPGHRQMGVSVCVDKYTGISSPFSHKGITEKAAGPAAAQWFSAIADVTDAEIGALDLDDPVFMAALLKAIGFAANNAQNLLDISKWSASERDVFQAIPDAIAYLEETDKAKTREKILIRFAEVLPMPHQLYNEVFHAVSGNSPFVVAMGAETAVQNDLDALHVIAMKGTARPEAKAVDQLARLLPKISALEKQLRVSQETADPRVRLLSADITIELAAAKKQFLAVAAKEKASLGLTDIQVGDFATTHTKVRALYGQIVGTNADVRVEEYGTAMTSVFRPYGKRITAIADMSILPYSGDISQAKAGFTETEVQNKKKGDIATWRSWSEDIASKILVDHSVLRSETVGKINGYYPQSSVTVETVDEDLPALITQAHHDVAAIKPKKSTVAVVLVTEGLKAGRKEYVGGPLMAKDFQFGAHIPENVLSLIWRVQRYMKHLAAPKAS